MRARAITGARTARAGMRARARLMRAAKSAHSEYISSSHHVIVAREYHTREHYHQFVCWNMTYIYETYHFPYLWRARHRRESINIMLTARASYQVSRPSSSSGRHHHHHRFALRRAHIHISNIARRYAASAAARGYIHHPTILLRCWRRYAARTLFAACFWRARRVQHIIIGDH